MSVNEVRIVELPAMRVASVHAYGAQPEDEAWQKLSAYARPKGYLDNLAEHRIFGFNNPSPSPGSPNYGYEFWIAVGPAEQPQDEVEIKQFPGGLYAVLRCEAGGDPNETIPAAWKRLVLWREESRYHQGSHQWLEEHLELEGLPEGEFVLDLYLPIIT